jgi:hypothetical protein
MNTVVLETNVQNVMYYSTTIVEKVEAAAAAAVLGLCVHRWQECCYYY